MMDLIDLFAAQHNRRLASQTTSQPIPSTWKPDYDAIVIDCHGRGLANSTIVDFMLDSGLPVSPHDVTLATRRLGLRANRHSNSVKWQVEPPAPKGRVNPLSFAKLWLGDRLVEKSTGFWLDGVPSNLDPVMVAANRHAQSRGAQQCLHNPRWEFRAPLEAKEP